MKNTFIYLGSILMGLGLIITIIELFKTWKKNNILKIKDLIGLFWAMGCIGVIVILYVFENFD